MLHIQNSEIEDQFSCAPFCSETCLFVTQLLSLHVISIHAAKLSEIVFARTTDDADGAIVLALLSIIPFLSCMKLV